MQKALVRERDQAAVEVEAGVQIGLEACRHTFTFAQVRLGMIEQSFGRVGWWLADQGRERVAVDGARAESFYIQDSRPACKG